MPWLLAPQAHLASLLILELLDIWFRQGRLSLLLTIQKVQFFFLGDDSLTESMGKGKIDLDHGFFKDVL